MRRVSLKNVSIIELMVTINKRYSKQTAVQIKDNGCFRKINYNELGCRTSDTAYNLIKTGIERGERVAILAESRPEWSVALFGIISCAAITVPLDTKLSETEIKFILNDSETKAIFVSQKYLETVLQLKPELPNLQTIILLDNEVAAAPVLRLVDFKVPEGEKAYRKLQPDDLALIVYTSGTTGSAKGVELTYRNLLFETMSLHELIAFSPKDRFLSILPLNHMLEITGGLFGPLYAGAEITYGDSLKPTTIMELMKETKTSVMLCVPLVLKMFHNGIFKKIADLPKRQKTLFDFLFALSKILLKLNFRTGKLFFRKIHRQFGGRLRCFVSGGAPLDPQVELDFNALGFNILQGYGLTETSPVITVNNFRERKYGSVGKPLPGIEVKILTSSETSRAEGEIITKGPHVMKGYYRNEAKTLEVLRDGWFYTGDIGYFDRDGFLYISGRSKNLIVLGAGKKVFPEEVEEVMNESQFIKEICVLGRIAAKGMRKGCEEVYAVVVPNLDNFPFEQRSNKTAVREKISAEITRLGEKLADYKRIVDFEIWEEELPKTSTRKIKRKILLDKIGKNVATGSEKAEYPENNDFAEDELTVKVKEIVQ
ncbi:MAG: AMP-binding protein [Elusimicrobia bacterium]|nr:AMP-binding protein [Elusimicrobiota bacterium]